MLQCKFAENPDTRRKAYEGFENRLAINVPNMSKFLDLRRQIAKLLGYPTWADYVTEVKMVKNAKSVKEVISATPRPRIVTICSCAMTSSSPSWSRSCVPLV